MFARGFISPIVIAILALLVLGGGFYVVSETKNDDEDIEMHGDAIMDEERDSFSDDAMMEKGDAVGAMEQNDAIMDDGDTSVEEKTEDSMMMDDQSMHSDEFTGNVLAGKSAPLLDFNKKDYEKALASKKVVVLYFYANWCPDCKKEFPLMEEAFNMLDTSNVIGFRVNYKDSETDHDEEALASEYGIAYQHTKVLLKDGKRIQKSAESWNRDRYLSEINTAL